MATFPQDTHTEAFAALRAAGTRIDDENWTETDTRSKFIDGVLKDCLGWSEENIRRELGKDRKRLDYKLFVTKAASIVEAKRGSIKYSVKTEAKVSRIKLSSLLKANPSLEEDVKQVAGYCHQQSVQVAILTNGQTWFCFMGTRTDQIPWEEGYALVVPNIYAKDFDFAEFYNAFSKAAIVTGETLKACNTTRLIAA